MPEPVEEEIEALNWGRLLEPVEMGAPPQPTPEPAPRGSPQLTPPSLERPEIPAPPSPGDIFLRMADQYQRMPPEAQRSFIEEVRKLSAEERAKLRGGCAICSRNRAWAFDQELVLPELPEAWTTIPVPRRPLPR